MYHPPPMGDEPDSASPPTKGLARIALAVAGTTKLFADGKNAVPPGFTMLWWGLHQLLGHNEE